MYARKLFVVSLTIAICIFFGPWSSATAADLRIGVATEASSMDPHWFSFGPNWQVHFNIFEPLVRRDENMKLRATLAESWKAVDDLTWEFKLRKGVKWHDGHEFTAEDVAFTLQRIPNVPNSPGPFSAFIHPIKSVEVVDPYTIRFKTEATFPLLPNYCTEWVVISKKIGQNTQTADYDAGKGIIGTGPYRFQEWIRGDRVVLTRNDSYWGEKAPWEKVIFVPISSASSRTAAITAGDIDLVENPPISDIPRIEKDDKLKVFRKISNRVIYLGMDQFREPPPGVTGTGDKNPFKDARVRAALSKAIDRKALCEKTMLGAGFPASQPAPPGLGGYDEKILVENYDPEGAKKLLAEAGYPNGFGITFTAPNNRYINDAKNAETIAAMFERIGIKVTLNTVPASILFSKLYNWELGFWMSSFGLGTGEVSSFLSRVVATRDDKAGIGSLNNTKYSNPELDRYLQQGSATLDEEKRNDLFKRAVAVLMKDNAVLLTHFEVCTWVARKDINYVPRADQFTMPIQASPKK
jgi:peptide/nickel transport system substrate-binding protein